MSAFELSNDVPRTFFAAVVAPRLHAVIARLEVRSRDRARRRAERARHRRSQEVLREMAKLPWEVRKDVGYHRDF